MRASGMSIVYVLVLAAALPVRYNFKLRRSDLAAPWTLFARAWPAEFSFALTLDSPLLLPSLFQGRLQENVEPLVQKYYLPNLVTSDDHRKLFAHSIRPGYV